MMTPDDLSELLSRWPYDEEAELQVRRVRGRDGLSRLQVRIDLGLMQLELAGRPDGRRPYGFASLLDYHRHQAEEHRRRHGWYEGYELDPAACAALRQESLQYYHRRVALMTLNEYEAAIADADHNLEILDLLRAFATDEDDWQVSEQYRAFITCHRVQCLVMQRLAREDVKGALLEVDQGLRQLRAVFAEQGQLEMLEDSAELAELEDLRQKAEARYHVSHRQRLHILLDAALRREDPDTAATLRAQLRELETE